MRARVIECFVTELLPFEILGDGGNRFLLLFLLFSLQTLGVPLPSSVAESQDKYI